MADSPPGSGIPIIGQVLQSLANIFGTVADVQGLAEQTARAEQNAWSNTLSMATWAYGLFGDAFTSLGDLIKGIGQALEKLFADTIWGFIKRLFDAIRKWITNLRNWIKLHVATLQQIQKNLDRARSQYFRRIIDIVQRIRKILVPFRLLHLGFAKKLDNYLVGLESDIGQKWAKLIQHNNQVLGVLNDIIDPRNLMRPGNMLGSVGLMIAAVHGAIGAADLRTLLCLGPSTAATPLLAPWSTTKVQLESDLRTRGGDYGAAIAWRNSALQQYSDDLGVPPLA